MTLKEKIIELRKNGKSYSEIKKQLNCSKATISFHTIRNGLITKSNKIDDAVIDKIQEFYRTHTIVETAKKFNVSRTTLVVLVILRGTK